MHLFINGIKPFTLITRVHGLHRSRNYKTKLLLHDDKTILQTHLTIANTNLKLRLDFTDGEKKRKN